MHIHVRCIRLVARQVLQAQPHSPPAAVGMPTRPIPNTSQSVSATAAAPQPEKRLSAPSSNSAGPALRHGHGDDVQEVHLHKGREGREPGLFREQTHTLTEARRGATLSQKHNHARFLSPFPRATQGSLAAGARSRGRASLQAGPGTKLSRAAPVGSTRRSARLPSPRPPARQHPRRAHLAVGAVQVIHCPVQRLLARLQAAHGHSAGAQQLAERRQRRGDGSWRQPIPALGSSQPWGPAAAAPGASS